MFKKPFITGLAAVSIFISAASCYAGTFTAYGPRTFVRGIGQPATETASFNIKNPNTLYTLHIYNGGIGSERSRVSSAVIKLNGSTVFDTNDFNQQVAHLQKQVSVTNSNQLEVELRSIPGSGLTVLLEGVDNDPPMITASADPQPNSYGWNKRDVTVAFTCSDPTSDIAVCSDPIVVSKEGAGQIISGTASDIAGNSASTAITVNTDKTAPIIEITSPQNNSTTNNSKPSITVNYSDGLSGIDLSTVRLTVDGLDVAAEAMITEAGITYTPEAALKDGAHSIVVYVSDKAGNGIETSSTFTIQLDRCPTVKLPLSNGQRPFIFPEPAVDTGAFYDQYDQVSYWDSEVNDLNGDGILDMLVKNYISGRRGMSVMLGKGDGSFESPINFGETAGGTVFDVSLADFNEDCFPDIATIVYLSNYSYQLRIFLNNGDGTFAQGTTSAINTLGEILTGDFNKDTYKDIAIMGFYGKLLVFQGKGDGSFSGPTELTIGDSLTIIDSISADFNRDGIIDIAATVIYRDYELTKVVLLTGNGDGTFQAPKVLITEILDTGKLSILVGLAAEDINMDGIPDILVSTSGHGDYPSGLAVLIGDGSGGFLRKPDFEFNLDIDYLPIRVKDFNGDGIPDIALQGYSKVYILIGNGDGTFKYPMMFNMSGNDLNTGDFDNDGAEDLVSTRDRVFILFARGDGTFIDRKEISVSQDTSTWSVLSADFDGDNRPDLAMKGVNGLLFSTILNNGNAWNQGTFQGNNEYRVGDGPVGVKIKDLDGDGLADVVAANELSNNVTVTLNRGEGSFFEPAAYQVGEKPSFIAIEDVNGDGKPDIVTANYGSDDISVLLGIGDGAFHPHKTYAVGSNPKYPTVGDFNADGKQDIAVVNSGPYSKTVSILFGNGDGTFKPESTHTLDRRPSSMVKGDFNEDGFLDLIVLLSQNCPGAICDSGGLTLLLGKGDGAFINGSSYLDNSTHGASDILAGDFNKDGRLDLITSNGGGSVNPVAVFLGDGNGVFRRSQVIINSQYISQPILKDINNDGETDILFFNQINHYLYGGSLDIWFGKGDGTFEQGASIGGWKDVRSLDAGDINGDGITDIALVDYKSLYVISGSGDGVFYGEIIFHEKDWNDWTSVVAADFNGDNNQDIVVSTSLSDSNRIEVYLGTGYNTFTQGTTIETTETMGLENKIDTGDFNGDGLPDIAFSARPWKTKTITIYLNRGNGTFGESISYNIKDMRTYPEFADINNDGYLDIISLDAEITNGWYSSHSISIHTGNGDGTFQYYTSISLLNNPVNEEIVIKDFNGDGFPDLAAAVSHGTSWFSYKIEIFINNGNGVFSSVATNVVGIPLIADDFNHDDKMDMIVTDGSAYAFALLIGKGDGTFEAAQYYSAGYGAIGKILSEDFNLDGRPDIVTPGYDNINLLLNTLPPLRTPPSPPKKLAGKSGNGAVSLTWAANAEEDISGYNVYRSLSAGGGYVKLNNTTVYSPTYTDTSATKGTAYYYTVSAVDKDSEESSYAFKVKVTPTPPDTTSPVIKINTPINGGTVYSPNLFILGTINETDSKVTVNSISGTVQKNDGMFTVYGIPLKIGENLITVTAVDPSGNTSSDSIKVAYVPTATISGVVKDEFTGQPVQWASVYVTDLEKTINFSTGTDGKYFFSKLIPGEVTITANAHNYDSVIMNKTLSSGEAATLDILMPLIPATLRGTVYNASTSRGITGATVTVTDRKKSQTVTTDNWGSYEVTNITPYDTTVTISKEGYETYAENRNFSNWYAYWGYFYLKALPPSAPTGLSPTPGGGYITLTWNQSLEDLNGYNIYRSTTPGSGYMKLNSYPEYYTSYKDTNVAPGTTYYYVITAVNTSNQESSYSAEASAAPRDVYSPTSLTATAGEGFVELNWSPSADSDISGYKIYRSTSAGTGYSYITTTSGTYYKDKSVTGGTTYYYVATAVNTISKESPYSNEASAMPEELNLSVSITYPKDGEWLKNSRIIVRGTIETASNEAGVVIETGDGKSGASARYLAQVNSQEFAAVVNLPEGFSYIKAIATDGIGNKSESSVMVSSMPSTETVRLTASPESGIMTLKTLTSPYPTKEGFPMPIPQISVMDVTLEAETYLPDPATSYSWDTNGDGWPEEVGTIPEITASYYSPGLYFPTVTVMDSKGNTYTAITIVNVLSKDAMDALLKGKWASMIDALNNGDAKTALSQISSHNQDAYQTMFNVIGEQLPSILSTIKDFTVVSVTNGIAKYNLRTAKDSGLYSYEVIFVKGSDGLWKIEEF